jgi:hypothetical protein
LSHFLFCKTLIPLTHELNIGNCGYQIYGADRKISHILYIDDLKLFGRSEEDLENEMKIVKTFSKNINMSFGLGRYAKMFLKNGYSLEEPIHWKYI